MSVESFPALAHRMLIFELKLNSKGMIRTHTSCIIGKMNIWIVATSDIRSHIGAHDPISGFSCDPISGHVSFTAEKLERVYTRHIHQVYTSKIFIPGINQVYDKIMLSEVKCIFSLSNAYMS